MGPLARLENVLADVYKSAPPLSPTAKKSIANTWPTIALVLGVLQLIAAWSLWHWGHQVNQVSDYANSIAATYGQSLPASHLNMFYWTGLVVLVVDGILLLAAYSGLKARTKQGWNLVFLSAILNIVYGVATALDNHGGIDTLIFNLIFSAIVLYFIFQIRDQYTLVRTKPVVRRR